MPVGGNRKMQKCGLRPLFYLSSAKEYNKYMEISSLSVVYIFTRLGMRLLDFFRHWYVDGFFKAVHLTLNFLERMDHRFALRITFKNWLQPLYQDYSFIGYLWGFVFRTIRILVGLVVYMLFVAFALGLFAIWAAIPLYVIYQVVFNLLKF
jgi:hypothetical protein